MDGCEWVLLCAFLEYFHGWVRVGVIVENTFTGGCTFLEYICEWVSVFLTVKGTFMGGCILKKTLMNGCNYLEDIYG